MTHPFYINAQSTSEIAKQIEAQRERYAQLRAERVAVEPIDRRNGERRAVNEFLEYVDRRQNDRRFAAKPQSVWET